uniref:Uncharacterized protein n=1 Tax=Anguilla anguilla TaxID=7936 RepID=A0A0E9XE10_ANGAN
MMGHYADVFIFYYLNRLSSVFLVPLLCY